MRPEGTGMTYSMFKEKKLSIKNPIFCKAISQKLRENKNLPDKHKEENLLLSDLPYKKYLKSLRLKASVHSILIQVHRAGGQREHW